MFLKGQGQKVDYFSEDEIFLGNWKGMYTFAVHDKGVLAIECGLRSLPYEPDAVSTAEGIVRTIPRAH